MQQAEKRSSVATILYDDCSYRMHTGCTQHPAWAYGALALLPPVVLYSVQQQYGTVQQQEGRRGTPRRRRGKKGGGTSLFTQHSALKPRIKLTSGSTVRAVQSARQSCLVVPLLRHRVHRVYVPEAEEHERGHRYMGITWVRIK